MSASTAPAWRTLYPFTDRHHILPDGMRMHYVDEGQETGGSPLVLLHGNPSWSFYYRRVIEHFRGRHRVIAPDHIGMGLSEKPQAYPYTLRQHIDNLESLLAPMDLQNVTLMVHDWGGAIGMGWAGRHPERIGRIVILNTAAFRSTRIPLRIAICRIPLFGALAIRGLNAFAGAATSMAVETPMAQDVKAGFLAPYDSWAHRIATHRFVQDIPLDPGAPSAATLCRVESDLAKFSETPILIQWGGRDWCFDRTFYEEWIRRFPQADAEVYEAAGHYVLEDAHEQILPRVASFIAATGGEE